MRPCFGCQPCCRCSARTVSAHVDRVDLAIFEARTRVSATDIPVAAECRYGWKQRSSWTSACGRSHHRRPCSTCTSPSPACGCATGHQSLPVQAALCSAYHTIAASENGPLSRLQRSDKCCCTSVHGRCPRCTGYGYDMQCRAAHCLLYTLASAQWSADCTNPAETTMQPCNIAAALHMWDALALAASQPRCQCP